MGRVTMYACMISDCDLLDFSVILLSMHSKLHMLQVSAISC